MRYNIDCHAVQNTRALCFSSAARDSQSYIVGKVPSINGIRSVLAVPRDNGSAICEGHFVMDMNTNTMIYLYMYRNKNNGKAYIGVTKDPKKRFRKHADGNSAAISFNHAVKKHGIDNFKFSILAMFDDVEAANYHENAAISAFGSLSPKGYNLIGGAPRSKYFGPMFQEVKDKIGKANKGRKLSPESLEKLSRALQGRLSWNKGKKMSEEHCAKLSKAHKGQRISPEQQLKINKSIRNYWDNRTPEQLEEYSQKVKKQWVAITPDQRADIARKKAEKLTGKPLSPEHCKKNAENFKKYRENETPEKRIERLRKHSESMMGHKTSQETRMNISNALKGNQNFLGKHHSDETKQKISRSRKEWLAKKKSEVLNG